jgi:hypothetical protein
MPDILVAAIQPPLHKMGAHYPTPYNQTEAYADEDADQARNGNALRIVRHVEEAC